MAISLQADYAMRLACELAEHGADRYVPVRRIAESAGVPYEYARAICTRLVCSHLLLSRRGPNGGIKLARAADEITLLEIIKAVDGGLLLSSCVVKPGLQAGASPTALHRFWQEIDGVVAERLDRATLGDIVCSRPRADQA